MFTPYAPNFQSLMLMLDAAHMGWWKANFQTGELYVSEYIARLLGLDGDKIRIGQLTHLIREDYRMPIHNEFMALKVGSKFDRTFPVELPEGEVWLHAQLVRRQTDPDTGTHLFGYIQRVPVHDRREAEILTLENNYHTVVKENKHMDVLLDHLPIGYFRIRLLYDSDGRIYRQDGTRDRAPRRRPYRQTRAHPPRRLQGQRMVCGKNRTILPQFPV